MLNNSIVSHTSGGIYRATHYSPVQNQLFGDSASMRDNFITKEHNERSLFARKLLFENLFRIDTGDVHLTLDPIFEANIGNQTITNGPVIDKMVVVNSRGFLFRGRLGKKLYFETSAMENQATFHYYLQDYINNFSVVPGQGRVKDFKENQFDYSNARGYVLYQPWKFLSVQAGQDKHFIGSGYRSIIHSDNSFNYPFIRFRLNTRNEKWSYTLLYNEYQDLQRLPPNGLTEPPFYRKGGNIMQLKWRPMESLEIGLVESHIWRTMDTLGKKVDNVARYNPVIVSGVANGLSDHNRNSLLALDVVYRSEIFHVYGQYAMSEFDSEKSAMQLGIKLFPVPNLAIRLEYNDLDNRIFTHDSLNLNFVHYSQSMAHPQGNGMVEYLAKIEYRIQRVLLSYSFHSAFSNAPSIYIYDEYATRIYSGALSYIVNPATNMQLTAGAVYRKGPLEGYVESSENTLVYLGFRTNLFNRYYDF